MSKTFQKNTRMQVARHGDLAAQLWAARSIADAADRNDASANIQETDAALEERCALLEALAIMQHADTVNDAHVQVLLTAKALTEIDGMSVSMGDSACHQDSCQSLAEDLAVSRQAQFEDALRRLWRIAYSLSAFCRASGSTLPDQLIEWHLPNALDPLVIEHRAIAGAARRGRTNGVRHRA